MMKTGDIVILFFSLTITHLLLISPVVVGRDATYVAENGTDGEDLCINQGIQKPCKTLTFVFFNLEHCHDQQCIVHVLYDQSVNITRDLVRSNVSIIGGKGNQHESPVTLTIFELKMKPFNSATKNTLQFCNIVLLVTDHGLRIGTLVGTADNTPINSGSVIFKDVSFKAQVNLANTLPFYLISLYDFSHIEMTDCTFDISNDDLISRDQVTVFYAYRFYTLVLNNCSLQYELSDGSFSIFSVGNETLVGGHPTVKVMGSRFHGFLRKVAFFRLFQVIGTGSIQIENTTLFSNVYNESQTIETGVIPDLALIAPANETTITNTEFTDNYMQLIKVDSSMLSGDVHVLFQDVIASKNRVSYVNLISVLGQPQLNISSNVTFQNVVIKDNVQYHQCINDLLNDNTRKSCLVYFEFANVTLSNSTFINNSLTTPLGVQSGILYLIGDILFEGNKACNGGGVRLNRTQISGTASFMSNVASERGAAIYTDCFHIIPDQNLTLQFKYNSANGLIRSNIYLDADGCINCPWYSNPDSYFSVIMDNTLPLLLSYPTHINITSVVNNASTTQHQLNIFPGEEIVLKLDVDNCGIHSGCIAGFKLVCGDDLLPCRDFQISGFPLLTIHTGIIYTNLTVISYGYETNTTDKNRKLEITCRDGSNFSSGTIPLVIDKCLVGMKVDKNLTCTCPAQQPHIQCSAIRGAICVKKKYWIGFDDANKSSIITHPCSAELQHTNCWRKYITTCPRDVTTYGDPADFELLDVTTEGFKDQCINNHDGLLCMYCPTDYTPTYFAMDCIPDSTCRSWHAGVLILITVLSSVVVGSALVMGVQPKLNVGLGYLYGPFFYLAALNHITLPTTTYSGLSIVVKFSTTLYLLEYQLLGYAPLCFFKDFNPLYNVGLQYLNPLILTFILLITIILAKLVPRVFLRLQPNPVQSMSVVLLVSYWSLTKTSVQILLYTEFENKPGIVPILHPKIPYFTGVHIPLVIIASCVLAFLSFHLLTLILSQCIGFYRLKPFLDQFQSCYQDKYRWFSIAYAFAMISMAPVSITGYEQIAKTIILTATLLQCVAQPFKKKWLNIVSTLILVDLSFLVLLNNDNTILNKMNAVVTWILIMGPLLYIFIGTCVLMLLNTGLPRYLDRRGIGVWQCWEKARERFVRDEELSASIHDREREPIIGLIIQRAQR